MESPKYHYTKSIWAVLLCCLMVVSCTQEEELAAVGYLSFPGIEVSQTVEDMAGTRADIALPIGEAPTIAELTYTVTNKESNEKVYNEIGPWTGELSLTPGTYTIQATDNENKFNQAYFEGSTEITIAAGQHLTTENFTVSLKNALLQVKIDAELAEHFKEIQDVELKTSTASATVALDTWIFVPSGEIITMTINGKNSAGNSATFTHTVTPSPRTASIVKCTKDGTNWPTITLPEQQDGAWNTRLYVTPATVTNMSATNQAKIIYEVSESNDEWSTIATSELIEGNYHVIKGLTNDKTYYVRARLGEHIISKAVSFKVNEEFPYTKINATHYNDGSGYLAGTNATVSLGLTGILKTLNDAGLLVFDGLSLSNGSTVVRSASTEGTVMSAADGWPYLPQGSVYVLTGNHKIKGESTAVSFTKSGLSVPAPTFTVTTGGYSSYDKYAGSNGNAKDVSAANNCNAKTIYNMSASWGITEALMNNNNYTKSVIIFLDGTEKGSQTPTTNSYTLGDISSLAVGTRSVHASLTFDGVTVNSEPKKHRITGLPVNFTPPTEAAGWKGSGTVNWNSDGGVRLGRNTTSQPQYIYNDGFDIPQGTKVKFTYNVRAKSATISTTLSISLGNDELFSERPGWMKDLTFNSSMTHTMSAAATQFKCNNSYGSGQTCSYIYSLDLKYAE